ncbi:MAG: GTPase HflX [Pseudomonadota bacterium]|nr:GTPase HflX [Pseudomonadota bacterium]
MFERPKAGQKAVLVHLEFPGADFESDRAEFIELARSAGAEILEVVGGSRRLPDSGLFIGSGKAEEIAALVAAQCAELVIFNHTLSPSQERNLEREFKTRVLDRSGLILDIFATRARSHEGKLQVELAQLNHIATRLVRGWTHLERQRGGIGLRGPGETQLETDRRLIRGRIGALKKQLEDVRSRRARSRAARGKNEVPTVSIVGYTNAGKSTLFNALTGNSTFASSQLFATLDTTVRRMPLRSGEHVVVADTVGFIRDLPHDLVAAFRATLEEARDAALLLHVVDSADPERSTRIAQVEAVLEEIGAAEVPRLEVFNKIDLRPELAAHVDLDGEAHSLRVFVSAQTGDGLELLRDAVAERLDLNPQEHDLVLPPQGGRLRSQLFERRAVLSESLDEDGNYRLRVSMPTGQLLRLYRAAGLPIPESIAGAASA